MASEYEVLFRKLTGKTKTASQAQSPAQSQAKREVG